MIASYSYSYSTRTQVTGCWPLLSAPGQLEGEIVGFEAGDGQKPRVKLMDGTVVTAVTGGGAGGITFWVELVKKKTDGIEMYYSFWMEKTV